MDTLATQVLQIAQSKSLLCTLEPKVISKIYILGGLGKGNMKASGLKGMNLKAEESTRRVNTTSHLHPIGMMF